MRDESLCDSPVDRTLIGKQETRYSRRRDRGAYPKIVVGKTALVRIEQTSRVENLGTVRPVVFRRIP